MDTADDTCEKQTVALTVRGAVPVQGRGALIGLAVVELNIAGVELVLQGVTVMRTPAGVEVRSPVWRHPSTGQWLPGVLLPPELASALTTQTVAALREAVQ